MEQVARRKNNFNLLRMLAAIAVLVSHAYSLSLGLGTTEPLDHALGMSLGVLAVLTFFAISGYFISQSFDTKRSLVEFATARVLRLYPGLFVALFLSAFILGPIFTTLHYVDYITNQATMLYVPRNIVLWPLQDYLPGVFDSNPYPTAINGSLWSLAYEVACYVMVAVVMTLSQSSHRRFFTVFLIAFVVFYLATIPVLRSHSQGLTILRNMHLVMLPFVIGMSLFEFRKVVPLRIAVLIVLSIAAIASYKHWWFHEIFVITWSYGVFYIGFSELPLVMSYNKMGDYSYGTYIYGFPVQQAVASVSGGCTPLVMMIWSLPLTILLAVLSWHLIEQRALAQRSIWSQFFSQQGARHSHDAERA